MSTEKIWLALVGANALERNEYVDNLHGAYVNVAAVAADEPEFISYLHMVFEEHKFEIFDIDDIETEDSLIVDDIESSEKVSLIIEINKGNKFAWGTFYTFLRRPDDPIKIARKPPTIFEKLKQHQQKGHGIKLSREVRKGQIETSRGHILSLSKQLVLLHQSDEFKFDGYLVVAVSQIKKIHYGKSEKYFDKIMRWEHETERIGIPYPVDLHNWAAFFKSIQIKKINVIVECEASDIDTFTIGPIEKVGSKYVYILYFDAEGYFDDSATSIDYDSITKVTFESHYVNIFSKYTRHRKA